MSLTPVLVVAALLAGLLVGYIVGLNAGISLITGARREVEERERLKRIAQRYAE